MLFKRITCGIIIYLTIVSLIVFVREIPTLIRFIHWLWNIIFPVPPHHGKGGDVTITPGKGSPGFRNGRIYLKDSQGRNIIVIDDSTVWIRAASKTHLDLDVTEHEYRD